MEPKHKELLDQCHQNLLESITDADRVIELLIVSGTLSQLDRFELDQNCTSSAEKVDHLLKMLMNKESDHFSDLCVALEKAYPDLHSALFRNNGGPVDHSTGLLIITLTCTLLGLIVGHGQKQAMTEEMYNVIVRKLRGEFHVPVSERTRIQQNALVRLWRNQGVYSLSEDGQTLLCAGKPVMLQSNVDCVVKKGLDDTKGSGARKLSKRLKMHHSGISERKVQEILNKTEWYQLQNAKFLNKPPLMTIQAKEVQDRHQIDLLDMGKMVYGLAGN